MNLAGFGLLLVAITGKAGARQTGQGRAGQAQQRGAHMGAPVAWLAVKLWQATQLVPSHLACLYGPHNGTGRQWGGLVTVL